VTNEPRPLRIVLTKAGLDAHERGMHVVSRGLRDHGFEVIVLGLRQRPPAVVHVAIQEDADIIGISSLAGGHLSYVRAVAEQIREQGSDAALIVGGVIPQEDAATLLDLGVAAIFPPGSLVSDMAAKLHELCDTDLGASS
jgi:methylmalonyl-CoA mutase, C-terminal domain